MGPRDTQRTPQDGLFRHDLASIVDSRHAVVKLVTRIAFQDPLARANRLLLQKHTTDSMRN